MKHALPLFRSLVLTMILAFGLVSVTFANVTVTAATGGTNISADNAANSTSPAGGAWTTLTSSIVITETNNNDIAAGTGKTFLINAPTGWKFNTNALTISATGNGMSGLSAVTDVSGTFITVTYTASGTGGTPSTSSKNSFTIGNIQVKASAGSPISQLGNITITAGTGTIAGLPLSNAGSLSLQSGAATTLNMSTIPTPQSPNNTFSITITGTDQFGNGANGSLTLSANAGTVTPATATLANGTVTTSVSVNTAGTGRTIKATAAGGVFVTSNPFDVLTSSATDYFRSQASGSWATPATWQSSHDSSAWFTATLVPTSSAKRVIIQGTNNVAIAASLSAPNITINSGATLTVNSTRTLTLNSGSDTSLYILGTLSNSGTVTLSAGALIAVDNGGTYMHAQDGGVIPTAKWDVNSTCNVSGVTFTTPSAGLGQAFGNFTWSSSNQFGAIALNGALTTINGTFTYASSGTNALRLNSSTATTPTINIGGDFDMQSGTLNFDDGTAGVVTLNIEGDVNITGGTLDPNEAGTIAHIIKVGGNWTLNTAGTFTAGSAGVTFNGSSAQTISGTRNTTFNNLTINGAGVTVSKSIFVSGILNFTSGIINTATATLLTINNGGSVTNASNNSFVNGPITKIGNSAFTFPIGVTGTGYVPIGISAPSSATSAFLAQYNRGNAAALGTVTAAGLDHMNVCDYWTLYNTGTASTAISVIGFWNTSSPCNGEALNYYINDISHVALAHLSGANWSTFGNISITGDNITGGSVTFTGLTTFSASTPFAIGSTTKANPLPVTLINFKAVLNSNNSVSLTWQTVEEENSNYFDVQRSDDGKNWSSIGTVDAQGNSAVTVNYSEMDLSPLKGADYYRLRLVNTNGSSSYSDIRVITMNAIAAFRIFPNPATDYVNVSLGQISNNSVVRMFNLSGQVVFSQQLNNASGNTISVPVHNLAEGTYTLQVMGSDGSQQSGRVIVVR